VGVRARKSSAPISPRRNGGSNSDLGQVTVRKDRGSDSGRSACKSKCKVLSTRGAVRITRGRQSLEPQYPISLSTRRRCLRGLAKICGEYDILPSSYIVPDSKVQKDGNLPVSFGGFSDVWKGFYGEERKAVAIKVIRQYETVDIRGIKKVSSFNRLFSHDRTLSFCRTSAERR